MVFSLFHEKTCHFDIPGYFLCRLFCSMLCSDPKLDSHRFKDILDEAITAGIISSCFF